MLRTYVLICAALGIAIGTVAPGCGGKDSGASDASVVDTPRADAPAVDASTNTEITIRTFPEGIPSYTGHTENAPLVAFQDGDGLWRVLTGTGGVYHATVTSRRYGVAVGCTVPFHTGISLYYQSVIDTPNVFADGCPSDTNLVHVSVDVQGLQGEQRGEVWIGSEVGVEVNGMPAQIDALKGSADMFIRSYTTDADTGARILGKLYRGPTLDLQTNQDLKVDLDTLGRPPESHPLSLVGLKPAGSAAETVQVHSSYATPFSLLQWPLFTQDFGTMKPDSYVTIDAAQRQSDDISNITATASGTTTDGRSYARYVRFAMKTPASQTLGLPVIWTATAPTLDRTPTPKVTMTIPITPPTLDISDYHASFSTNDANVLPHTLTVFVRPGYANGQSPLTITTPDLSGLPGWSAEMGLVATADLDWSLEWDDRNKLYESLPVDGRRILGSIIQGTIPMPTTP
jgi:hypothetical protein